VTDLLASEFFVPVEFSNTSEEWGDEYEEGKEEQLGLK
jgi:hypothetical protein